MFGLWHFSLQIPCQASLRFLHPPTRHMETWLKAAPERPIQLTSTSHQVVLGIGILLHLGWSNIHRQVTYMYKRLSIVWIPKVWQPNVYQKMYKNWQFVHYSAIKKNKVELCLYENEMSSNLCYLEQSANYCAEYNTMCVRNAKEGGSSIRQKKRISKMENFRKIKRKRLWGLDKRWCFWVVLQGSI